MKLLAVGLAGANLVVLVVLVALLVGVHHRTEQARARLGAVDPHPVLPAELERPFGEGRRRVIVVEILNPLELAAQEHRLGGIVGGLAPGALRKVVTERAARDLEQELVDRGVVAEVSIRAVG